jgi:hypothetical protein
MRLQEEVGSMERCRSAKVKKYTVRDQVRCRKIKLYKKRL